MLYGYSSIVSGLKDGSTPTEWRNCKAFGKSAELVQKYVKKGKYLVIEGHGNSYSFVNKSGQTVNGYEVIVDHIELGPSNNNVSQQNNNSNQTSNYHTQPPVEAYANFDNEDPPY